MLILILTCRWHKNYLRLVNQREELGGEPGGADPEFRLPPAIAGGVLVPIGLFWFGWSTYDFSQFPHHQEKRTDRMLGIPRFIG